ncbi:MAG: alpha/beta fold hydrolase [Terrimicrobiaceae bacterium]
MNRALGRPLSWLVDGTMCNMMHAIQWRRRADANSRRELHDYIGGCAPMTREEFFRMPEARRPSFRSGWMEWDSPHPTGHPENDRVRVQFYPARERGAPTVLLLHALMSASDVGYRRLAAWFNANGWSVVFPHLPYHYSRTPRRTWNGELAVTANLVRNAEGLRQGVVELRQLMALLRTRGTREFAILGTSYGGWTGALLSFLERDFRFIALVQPIVNTEKAVWDSPGSAVMRRELRARGHLRGNTAGIEHLGSPLHGIPLCDTAAIVVTGGLYDRISPIQDLEILTQRWPGSQLLRVPQGHFGYSALRETVKAIEPWILAGQNEKR